MIKGLFTSASGMVPRVRKQEMHANNIANANSPGFKRDGLFTKELSRAQRKLAPTKSDWETPMVNDVYTDYTVGAFDKTGNPLDMAIDGDGFFSLQLDDGSTVLTRAGSFQVDENGFLAFPGGALVLGEGGPINIGSGQVSVSATGQIQSNGLTVGRITPVTVDDLNKLDKIGQSAFAVPQGVTLQEVENATIVQGFLETSNVDIVREMIDMIISFREYEADARALQTQDQSLSNLFGRVGDGQ